MSAVRESGTTFYFDLGSPFAYLTAERIEHTLRGAVVWQPLSLGALFKITGRSSWALGDPQRRRAGMAEVERRALAYGLAPLRWPEQWPTNYLFAMRVATAAEQLGRGEQFARQAFRSAFQQGLDLQHREHVLAAAAEVGLDAAEIAAAAESPAVKLALREATEEAHRRGVFGVPTIAVGERLLWGDDRLQEAAAS